ncbi:MAG TPA: hypothetical protein ENK35_08555, partial [Candidatus Tenderia sp.]|nr:hypothetical protein [Candidatus Tenderia sp.]
MERFENAFGYWVVRARWLLIPVVLLAVVLAAGGAQYLKFTSDYRVFFSADNPQLLAFDEMEQTYTKDDNVLIVLTPADGNVFSRDTLAVVEKYTRQAWQIPYSIRVDSITDFQYTEAQEDDLIVRDLVSGAEDLSDAAL